MGRPQKGYPYHDRRCRIGNWHLFVSKTQEIMNPYVKNYLMVAGALLPATIGLATMSVIRKEHYWDRTNLIITSSAILLGGYITARMLYNK